MRKRNEDRRVARTKKAIQHALGSLFSELPYDKISVNDICEKAEVHRATFYNYYRSKDDLFSNIINDFNKEFLKKVEDNGEDEIDSIVSNSTKILANYSKSNCGYISKVIKAQEKGVAKEFINKLMYQNFYHILTLHPTEGRMVPKDFMASFYSGIMTNVVFYFAENNTATEEDVNRYVNYCLNR